MTARRLPPPVGDARARLVAHYRQRAASAASESGAARAQAMVTALASGDAVYVSAVTLRTAGVEGITAWGSRHYYVVGNAAVEAVRVGDEWVPTSGRVAVVKDDDPRPMLREIQGPAAYPGVSPWQGPRQGADNTHLVNAVTRAR